MRVRYRSPLAPHDPVDISNMKSNYYFYYLLCTLTRANLNQKLVCAKSFCGFSVLLEAFKLEIRIFYAHIYVNSIFAERNHDDTEAERRSRADVPDISIKSHLNGACRACVCLAQCV